MSACAPLLLRAAICGPDTQDRPWPWISATHLYGLKPRLHLQHTRGPRARGEACDRAALHFPRRLRQRHDITNHFAP